MPKLELTKEQLATLREGFVFGVEDRGSLDDVDKAILAAIDHALVEPAEPVPAEPAASFFLCNATVPHCNRRTGHACSMCPWDGKKETPMSKLDLTKDQPAGLANLRKDRFHGIDRTKDGGTGGGVKERQVLLLTVAEHELLIEALRRATYEAQSAFDNANSKTELIGNDETLGAYKKHVDDLRALLLRAQELINS